MIQIVEASPETVHWGYLSAEREPVATVDSGDTIVIRTVSGHQDTLPPPGDFTVSPVLRQIHEATTKRMLPGHMCTGPVAVRGASPGDVLQVDIEEIVPAADWAYTAVRPLRGALTYDFAGKSIFHSRIDAEAMTAETPWGMEVPLRPFFGVMASAPPHGWGTISTVQPRPNGGNIDNRELVAGTTLFLPVFVQGALFSVGDGHGAQGDGEVCGNGLETSLEGRFRLSVRDDMAIDHPVAETPTHLMTMAFDPDLDDCVVIALRNMIRLLGLWGGLNEHQAYALCSLVGDLRITQVVNGHKGVHLMMPREYFENKPIFRKSDVRSGNRDQ